MVGDFEFRVSCLGFLVEFRALVSGLCRRNVFGFRIHTVGRPRANIWLLGFEVRTSDFGFRVFGFRVQGIGLRVSRYRVEGFFRCRVQGLPGRARALAW